MRVIGQAQLAQGSGVDELLKYKKSELDQANYYQSVLEKSKEREMRKKEMEMQSANNQNNAQIQESLEREKINLKREELLARLKISKDQLAIAKENKP